MKTKILQYTFIALSIIWMLIIFILSSQTADTSSQTSGGLSRILCSIFIEGFNDLPTDDQALILENMAHPIRKCAHAAEYFILAVLLAGALSFRRKNLLYAWLITVLYSISDEVHQIWVPGRTGKVLDVLNDSLAGLVGLAAVFAVVTILHKPKGRDK